MAIALTGLVVVLVGLALVPLPGPGWFIVLGGVAIWAIEFVWARHLLRTAREWVHRWNLWLKGQRPAVRRPLIAFVLAVVLVAVWLSLKISLGLDPVDRIFRGRFRD